MLAWLTILLALSTVDSVQHKAAHVISRAWLRYKVTAHECEFLCNLLIYACYLQRRKYFQQLVAVLRVVNEANPITLLRKINPREV